MWDWKDSLMRLNEYINHELRRDQPDNDGSYTDGYNDALNEIQTLISYAIFGCDPEDGVDITQWVPERKKEIKE